MATLVIPNQPVVAKLQQMASMITVGDFRGFRGEMTFFSDAWKLYEKLYRSFENACGNASLCGIPSSDDLLLTACDHAEIAGPTISIGTCPSCGYGGFCAVGVDHGRHNKVSIVIQCDGCELERLVTVKMEVKQ